MIMHEAEVKSLCRTLGISPEVTLTQPENPSAYRVFGFHPWCAKAGPYEGRGSSRESAMHELLYYLSVKRGRPIEHPK